MTFSRLLLLAFLPALLVLSPLVPRTGATAEGDAPITIRVHLEAGSLAAARIWRFEILDASGGAVDSVEVPLSGDATSAARESRPLPDGDYTVRQLLGNDMALACAPRVFYANNAPERAVRLDPPGAAVDFTITVCPDAPGGVDVNRPIDTVSQTPTGVIDDVQGTRVAGGQTPGAPGTGSGMVNATAHSVPGTPIIAAVAVLMLVAPVAIHAIRRD